MNLFYFDIVGKRHRAINENQLISVDGKPFFPIGIYSVNPPTVFKELREAGFNTVHTYEPAKPDLKYLKKYVGAAGKEGLKVLIHPGYHKYVAKGDTDAAEDNVRQLLDSSTILAWYLIDEPDLQGVLPGKVSKAKEAIARVDAKHPIALVVASPDKFSAYADSTDIFMVDPYPIGRGKSGTSFLLTKVSDYVKRARIAVKDQKPVWVVLQAFGYQNENNKGWGWEREPTYKEERCMTYLAIVHGAKGIFYYTYHGSQYYIKDSPKHWSDLKRIVSELKELQPILLSPDRLDSKIWIDNNSIHFSVKEVGGVKYIIAVNPTKKTYDVVFGGLSDISDMKVLFESREVKIIDGTMKDYFSPYDVHIYTSDIT